MPRLACRWFALLVVLVLLCPQRAAGQSREVTLALIRDTTFQYHGTQFRLVRAYVSRKGNLVYFKGEITHDDPAPWTVVHLNLSLFDASERPITVRSETTTLITLVDTFTSAGTRQFERMLFDDAALHTGGARVDLIAAGYPVRYLTRLADTTSSANEWGDDIIAASLALNSKGVSLWLTNQTDRALTIDWNRVSLVDAEGRAHKAMHAGVKYDDRAGILPPTVIPPHAHIEDEVYPADLVRFDRNSWTHDDMIEPMYPMSLLHIGKRVGLYIPITVNGNEHEYYFQLDILGADRLN